MGRCPVQAPDNIPASPQGANHTSVYVQFLLITRRRVMDQQRTAQTHCPIESVSFMITNNRHNHLRPLPCPFGSPGRSGSQEGFIHEEDGTSGRRVETSLEPPLACAQVAACRASAYPGRFPTSCDSCKHRRIVLVLISPSCSCFKTLPHKEAVHSACGYPCCLGDSRSNVSSSRKMSGAFLGGRPGFGRSCKRSIKA